MLCASCDGIRSEDLVSLETENEDEIRTCKLLNANKAFQHSPDFQTLCMSAQSGCNLCLLMSQMLEDDHNWNDEINIYGSSEGETISELILKLKSEQSASIYIYKLDGTDRQEDAGIFEIAIAATFSPSSNSKPDYEAFFWRALEIWPEAGQFHVLPIQFSRLKNQRAIASMAL